jgi:hypothetical protein
MAFEFSKAGKFEFARSSDRQLKNTEAPWQSGQFLNDPIVQEKGRK